MVILNYKTKNDLKADVGQPLRYTETSMFGNEYTDNGTIYGSNRPQITGCGSREWWAAVTMKDGLIAKVA